MTAYRTSHLPALDGWRGLAILAVLWGHFFPIGSLDAARLGVELFFVLSGRLMAQILFVDRMGLGPFFRRRIARVYPALVVFVAVMFLRPWPLDRLSPTLSDVVAALTFTLNYVRAAQNEIVSNVDHIWSLCVEEHSYIALATIAFLTRHSASPPIKLIAGVAALCALNGWISTLVFDQSYLQVYWRSDVRAASIFLGALMYLLVERSQKEQNVLNGFATLAALILGVALHTQAVPDPIKYTVGSAALAYGVATLPAAKFSRDVFGSRLLVGAGLLSYSIYLWQQPFSRLVFGLDPWSPWAAVMLVPFAGLASFVFVERPLRTFLNKHWTTWNPFGLANRTTR